jgi:CDP-diacylglycerol---serine O-phosphatidyltransferase
VNRNAPDPADGREESGREETAQEGGFRPPMFRRGGPRPRRPRRQMPRLRGLPLQRLIPNAMTVAAMCAGLTGVRYALLERWEQAVAAILVAAVLDGLDGRIARLLNAQSRFGEELDSLADAINFGVAPALVLYLWSLQGAGAFGWIAALALAVCCVLRLARFNAGLGADEKPAWAYNYFTGVPAPAGAGVALMPIALSFELGGVVPGHPILVALWTLMVAGLMISALPTFSFKRLRVPAHLVVPALVGVGVIVAALVSQPWWTLTFLGVGYVALIALSVRQYRKLAAAAAQLKEAEAPAAPSEAGPGAP